MAKQEMKKTLDIDVINADCCTCFHKWKKEDCKPCQECDTFSNYKVDIGRCEYCKHFTIRRIDMGQCSKHEIRKSCRSTCGDFELWLDSRCYWIKYDPKDNARCTFNGTQ